MLNEEIQVPNFRLQSDVIGTEAGDGTIAVGLAGGPRHVLGPIRHMLWPQTYQGEELSERGPDDDAAAKSKR